MLTVEDVKLLVHIQSGLVLQLGQAPGVALARVLFADSPSDRSRRLANDEGEQGFMLLA